MHTNAVQVQEQQGQDSLPQVDLEGERELISQKNLICNVTPSQLGADSHGSAAATLLDENSMRVDGAENVVMRVDHVVEKEQQLREEKQEERKEEQLQQEQKQEQLQEEEQKDVDAAVSGAAFPSQYVDAAIYEQEKKPCTF